MPSKKLVKELLEELLAVHGEEYRYLHAWLSPIFRRPSQSPWPITWGHTSRCSPGDRSRLKDIRRRMNYCPWAQALWQAPPIPLDREYTAELLGFDGPTLNSMDSVADRDYLIELLSALSTISMHLSRFCEEIIIWNTNEYRFVEIDDSYSTGSSIMPQKKNPDIAELIRGKKRARIRPWYPC